MALRIEYFRKGEKVGAVPCPRLEHEVLNVALNGLVQHDADMARVLDMDDKGRLLSVVRR